MPWCALRAPVSSCVCVCVSVRSGGGGRRCVAAACPEASSRLATVATSVVTDATKTWNVAPRVQAVLTAPWTAAAQHNSAGHLESGRADAGLEHGSRVEVMAHLCTNYLGMALTCYLVWYSCIIASVWLWGFVRSMAVCYLGEVCKACDECQLDV